MLALHMDSLPLVWWINGCLNSFNCCFHSLSPTSILALPVYGEWLEYSRESPVQCVQFNMWVLWIGVTSLWHQTVTRVYDLHLLSKSSWLHANLHAKYWNPLVYAEVDLSLLWRNMHLEVTLKTLYQDLPRVHPASFRPFAVAAPRTCPRG